MRRKLCILLLALMSSTAGAGHKEGKNYQLRCTQQSDRLTVKVIAESRYQIESMRAAMLRRGTISPIDTCILTIKSR